MSAPNKPEHSKKRSDFFVAVRARGVLNTMLDGPALRFEKQNPGWRARWEYAPPTGDKTFVVAREAMGFRIVDAAELAEGDESFTESEQKKGEVRRGDLILMAGPEDLVNELEYDDAKRAYEDWKLPETSYREHLKGIKVKTKDGSLVGTQAHGAIERKEEIVSGVKEPQHELEGGE